MTECLDPSVWLFERGDPDTPPALAEFDLYGKDAPTVPYSTRYLARFRAAQYQRSLRITEWARGMVVAGKGGACKVLDGTMSDPRWMDPTVDPNDRPGHKPDCYLGHPAHANDMPTGKQTHTTTHALLHTHTHADTA